MVDVICESVMMVKAILFWKGAAMCTLKGKQTTHKMAAML